MKNNKGIGVIGIILIIVGVLVVGGGVYYVGNNNLKLEDDWKGMQENLEKDIDSSWLSYSFEGNSFLPELSFKYPSDWKVELNGNDVNATSVKVTSSDGLSEISYFKTEIEGKTVTCDYLLNNDINGKIKCNMVKGLPFYLYWVNDNDSPEVYKKVLRSLKIEEASKNNLSNYSYINNDFNFAVDLPGTIAGVSNQKTRSIFTFGVGDQSEIEEEARTPNKMVVYVSDKEPTKHTIFLGKEVVNRQQYEKFKFSIEDSTVYYYTTEANGYFYKVGVINELDINNFYILK